MMRAGSLLTSMATASLDLKCGEEKWTCVVVLSETEVLGNVHLQKGSVKVEKAASWPLRS